MSDLEEWEAWLKRFRYKYTKERNSFYVILKLLVRDGSLMYIRFDADGDKFLDIA